MTTLILPQALRARLVAQARAGFPAECCGLVEGRRCGDGVTVTALHPTANLSPTPEITFELDPAVYFAVQRSLREQRGGAQRAPAVSEILNHDPGFEAGISARDGGPASVGRPRGGSAQRAPAGSEIIGCYHSHPNGRAEPSRRDRDNGCPDGFVWIIIATGVNEAVAAFVAPSFRSLTIR